MDKRELNKKRLKELRGELFLNRDEPDTHDDKNEVEKTEASENNEETDEKHMGMDM